MAQSVKSPPVGAAHDLLVEPTLESRALRSRRTLLVASRVGTVLHVVLLASFAALGIWPLVAFNAVSIVVFLAMTRVFEKGHLMLGVSVALLEVAAHQAYCTHLLGWDAGFAQFIVATTAVPWLLPKQNVRATVALFTFLVAAYVAIYLGYRGSGPRVPIDDAALLALSLVNRVSSLLLLAIMLYSYARASDDAEAAFAEAHQRSERLLRSILPAQVAERLKREPGTLAEGAAPVTVLFSDLCGFTPLSSSLPPRELVALLDGIFSDFDDLVEERGLTKIKTIGDAYMVAAGVPESRKDDAEAVAGLALAMCAVVRRRAADLDGALDMRVGIHSGAVVAGVIGKKTLAYDLWGDTVNTAARMESHGTPGRVHVTDTTRQRLGDGWVFEDRGMIEVKGKGPMHTWFLVGPAVSGDRASAAPRASA